MTTDVAMVLGTRPEIIKLAPVIRACEQNGVRFTLIHTGQHYSDELDEVIFEQLELPEPDHNLSVGSNSHGRQTGEMLQKLERILEREDPDVVLVQGDTNSVLAGAIVTCKMDIELGHVEAGLRSHDRTMPEELNRVVADHVSDMLFAPTVESRRALRKEGLPDDRIVVTGNTVVDALEQNQHLAERKSTILDSLGLVDEEFALLTAHRAENVDDAERFESLLQGTNEAARALDLDVVYPIHPRARKQLDKFAIDVPDRISVVEPQDYLNFIRLESCASLILTDSGGVQEEACVLGTPCVTLRDSTERPETVEVGANVLAGVTPDSIVDQSRAMYRVDTDWENPLGDGAAATRILEAVRQSD